MQLKHAERQVPLFVISPRTIGMDLYWNDVRRTIQWSEQYGCSGMLIFTGNDVHLDSFSVAQFLLERTIGLLPLIAVNPIYAHPFTAARMIASLTYIYERRIFLNMVTGTALNHLEALGDSLAHDERYERMLEYISIINNLIRSAKPFSLEGRFYRISNLRLPFCLPSELQPEFVLAGQSAAARKICDLTGAVGMQMLSSKLDNEVHSGRGIHFGVVTRPEKHDAWKAARKLFPADNDGPAILDLSMRNTDSAWKARMKYEADQPDLSESGYWLEPFRNCKADCPYFVGSYEQVATLICGLVLQKTRMFILDIPAIEHEYYHASQAFKLAQEKLNLAREKVVASGILAN